MVAKGMPGRHTDVDFDQPVCDVNREEPLCWSVNHEQSEPSGTEAGQEEAPEEGAEEMTRQCWFFFGQPEPVAYGSSL